MSASDPLKSAPVESAADFAFSITDRFGVTVTKDSRGAERRTRGGAAPFGRVEETGVGDLRFFVIGAAAHTVERDRYRIHPGDDDTFKLSVQLSGTSLLVQDSREAVIRPGDIAMYDTRRPYSIESDDDFRALIMLFPKDMISIPRDALGQITAVSVSRGEGPSELALPFLQRLGRDVSALTRVGGRRLAHMALDLVSMVYWQELRSASIDGNLHELLFAELTDYIDEHLDDPDLSPLGIAVAHYVSPRLLRAVFQARGLSVAAYIRSRRLKRCYEDLSDPLYAHLPIRSIASRWAFTDPPHFSRSFRAEFGMSPAELRNRFVEASGG